VSLNIGVWIASVLTLAIYSFLYKDNPFYKVAENIFVGVSAGYWAVILWFDFTWPNLFEPLVSRGNFISLIPIIVGLMMFAPLVPKISWLVRIPLTFTMGVAMALVVTQRVQGEIFPQLQATFLPLAGVSPGFYFSKQHKGVLGFGAKLGIWFMMIAFGASFGYTVMARISLLIGRVYFLLHNWLGLI
jgi:hypothetical protein